MQNLPRAPTRETITDDEVLDDASAKMNRYQREQGTISEYLELKTRLDTLSDDEFKPFAELRQGMKGSSSSATLPPTVPD